MATVLSILKTFLFDYQTIYLCYMYDKNKEFDN